MHRNLPGLLWVSLIGISCGALAEEPAYWAPVGALVQQQNYQAALQETDRLLLAHADDALLLRVKGICLVELDREGEAVTVLRRAVKLDPSGVAARFYLAQALACQGGAVEAIDLLHEVQKAAPESEYARRAAAVLPDLENLRSSRPALPVAHRFEVNLRVAGEYDDNVPVRSNHDANRSHAGSFRLVTAADIEFRPLDQQLDKTPFTLGVGYSIYQSVHERRSLNDYDLTSQSARLYLQRSGQFGKTPFKARLTGQYSNDRLGGNPFSDAFGLRAGLELQWAEWAVLSPSYSVDWKNFSNRGNPSSLYSRDGVEQSIGFEQFFYTFHNKLVLSLGYAYRWADTDGQQFRLNSHRIKFSATVALPGKWSWANTVSYATEDYVDFVPTPRRADDVITFSTVFSRPLWNPNATFDISYSHTASLSTDADADYRRNIVGMGLSYHF